MKKILLVATYPPPFGGIATHVVGLIPYLIERGYKVTVLSFSDRNEQLAPQENVKIIRICVKHKIKELFGPANAVGKLKSMVYFLRHGFSLKETATNMVIYDQVSRLIESEKIDLLSAYMIPNSYFIPLLRNANGKRLAIVMTVFAELYESPEIFASKRSVISELLNSSDQLLASSQYCADSVSLVGHDPKKVGVFYYSIDLNNFNPAREKHVLSQLIKSAGRMRLALFVGRFLAEMGLDVILQAIDDILPRRRELAFMLIGAKGKLDEEAERMRQKYPDQVFILHDLKFADLPGCYTGADFLIAPSQDKHACMGMAIKEAMACGRAVIASDSGGIPEAVVQDTGVIIPVSANLKANSSELVKAIDYLLDNPEICAKMGQEGRKRAERLFDNKLASQKLISLFDGLIAKRDA